MLQTSNPSLKSPIVMPGIPWIGNALSFVSANGVSVEFLLQAQRECGDVAHFKAMNQSFYLVSDPDLVRQVLLERVQEFPKPEAVIQKSNGLGRFLGHGILTAGYEEWRPQRKLIQPLMQHKHIAEYAETMARMGDQLLSTWQPGEQRDIHADMTQLTMWIIAETMFGISVEQSEELEAIGRDAQKIVIEDLASPFPSFLTKQENRTERINTALTNLVGRFVAERRAKGSSDRHDLLSILMETRDENGQPVSEEFLRNNILTMFFAGHETTANTLTWAFYYLSQHSYILQELQQEVDAVLASGRLPTIHDLPQLPYTLMVIKETMRIQPTVAMIPRFIDRDMSLGDYQLKAGSFVLISPYVLHRDPRRWNSPDNFVPIRFSEDNEKKIEKYAYLPFGGGPRICIGNHFALMEAHILLALIVSRFHLRLASGAKIEPLRYVTCAPKHGLPMVIEHRGS